MKVQRVFPLSWDIPDVSQRAEVIVGSRGVQLFLTFAESVLLTCWNEVRSVSQPVVYMFATKRNIPKSSFSFTPCQNLQILQQQRGGKINVTLCWKSIYLFWFIKECCCEISQVCSWEDLCWRHGSDRLSPHQRNSSQILIRCQNSVLQPHDTPPDVLLRAESWSKCEEQIMLFSEIEKHFTLDWKIYSKNLSNLIFYDPS